MPEARSSGSSRYTSVRVELIRHGADVGFLQPDTSYMVQIGDKPVREFKVPLEHVQFHRHMQDLDFHTSPSMKLRSAAAILVGVYL